MRALSVRLLLLVVLLQVRLLVSAASGAYSGFKLILNLKLKALARHNTSSLSSNTSSTSTGSTTTVILVVLVDVLIMLLVVSGLELLQVVA